MERPRRMKGRELQARKYKRQHQKPGKHVRKDALIPSLSDQLAELQFTEFDFPVRALRHWERALSSVIIRQGSCHLIVVVLHLFAWRNSKYVYHMICKETYLACLCRQTCCCCCCCIWCCCCCCIIYHVSVLSICINNVFFIIFFLKNKQRTNTKRTKPSGEQTCCCCCCWTCWAGWGVIWFVRTVNTNIYRES